jgi:septal ring factor EnvC (AmiA/AmiB activator)
MSGSLIRKYLIVLTLVFVWVPFAISQQDRSDLEEEKSKLEEEIEFNNRLLEQTQKSKQASLGELTAIVSKISKRENLIGTIQSEIQILNRQIGDIQDSIDILREELQLLKDEYAKMIYYAYKNKNMYDRLMFIFAAEDLNQAYQRLKYFQYYNQYRKHQAELIGLKSEDLQRKNEQLLARKSEQQALLKEQEIERSQLASERMDKDRTIQSLSEKEKDLRRKIKDQEAAARKLQKAIEDIIAEEIRLAAERAKKEGAETTPSGMFPLSPAEMALSEDFANNKGKLPWPLAQGIISSRYGEHPHPVLKNVKIMNHGIDIMTEPGSPVRAVFSGTVTRVINVPNNNNVVIIRHGEYLTVYSNLDEVSVRKGDAVSTSQKIGTVFTNPDESKTELHFEVWQSKTLLNPEEWILGR